MTNSDELNTLSIITITYGDNDGLKKTYNSLSSLLDSGVVWIIISHQKLDDFWSTKASLIIEGKDEGLYDALNIGLNEIYTKYFTLLHSGDTISDESLFLKSFSLMEAGYDCVLGGAKIGNRIHQSDGWKRWMMFFYVQPPHLPIIYRTASCGKIRYDTKIKTVSDFYYLKNLFSLKAIKIKHSHLNYIEMEEGGLTTSGIKSFSHVSFSFMAVDGIWPLIISPLRLLIKLLIR
jgi:glycosyltransferase involved in cell wall biosynthesis